MWERKGKEWGNFVLRADLLGDWIKCGMGKEGSGGIEC